METMNSFGIIDRLARAGFLVKGVLYMVIGALAVQVATSAGGTITGQEGALSRAPEQPFGPALLLAAAIGLFGYAFWRVLQGLFDPDCLGSDWRGVSMRASFVLRGLMHGALGWQAFRLYRGMSAGGGSGEREAAGEALQWPLGHWVVMLAGLALIGFAAQQVYAAITCRLERNLDVDGMRREAGSWAVGVSRFGVAARAVVFALLGWTIAVAGWSRDASEVGTTASSLRTLAQHPGQLGDWLLGITAAGLVAYGFYEILHARYLRIQRVG